MAADPNASQLALQEWFRRLDALNQEPGATPAVTPADRPPRDLMFHWNEYTPDAVAHAIARMKPPQPYHSATIYMEHFGYYNVDELLVPLWAPHSIIGPRAARQRLLMRQALAREDTRLRLMMIGRIVCGRLRARAQAPPARGRGDIGLWFGLGLCLAAICDLRCEKVDYAFEAIMALAGGLRYATSAHPAFTAHLFANHRHPPDGMLAASVFCSSFAQTPPGTWDPFSIQRSRFRFLHTTDGTPCYRHVCAAATAEQHVRHPWALRHQLPNVVTIMRHLDLLAFFHDARELGFEVFASVPDGRRLPARVLRVSAMGSLDVQLVHDESKHTVFLHYDPVHENKSSLDDLSTFRALVWHEPEGFVPGPVEINPDWPENMRVREAFSDIVMEEQRKSLELLTTLRWRSNGERTRRGDEATHALRSLGGPTRHIAAYLGHTDRLPRERDDGPVTLLRRNGDSDSDEEERGARRRKGRKEAESMNEE